MKSTLYVVPGKLVTKPILLTALERVTLWMALGVVLSRPGGVPEDRRRRRRLRERMAHSLGMRERVVS